MNKILQHLKENWIRHGFETLVVVVGVLIAFTLSNWNEIRNERKLESDYLQLILADIQADKNLLDSAITFVDVKMKSLEIINDITLGRPVTDTLEWAIVESANLGWTLSIDDHAEATYDELISSGHLRLIIDSQLRKAILDYYSFWNHTIERTHQRRSNYPNLTYKLFAAENLPKNDVQFKEILKTLNVESEFLKEMNHEINYGRFVQNTALPVLIEKNKLI